MARKEEILRSILDNEQLRDFAGYVSEDYATMDDALDSDNVVVRNVAALIEGEMGEMTTESDYKRIYNTLSNDLQTNLLLI